MAAILDGEMRRGLDQVKSDPKGEDDWRKNESLPHPYRLALFLEPTPVADLGGGPETEILFTEGSHLTTIMWLILKMKLVLHLAFLNTHLKCFTMSILSKKSYYIQCCQVKLVDKVIHEFANGWC